MDSSTSSDSLGQQICGQIAFICDKINTLQEPQRSQIKELIARTMNQRFQQWDQVPLAEVVE